MGKTITEWVQAAHRNAVEHGWWSNLEKTLKKLRSGVYDVPGSTDVVLAKIALMHSELSEALEAVRVGQVRLDYPEAVRLPDGSFVVAIGAGKTDLGKPEGLVVELADCVIRIFDLCGALGLDLEGAIEAKHAYNVTRPHRHGGKLA